MNVRDEVPAHNKAIPTLADYADACRREKRAIEQLMALRDATADAQRRAEHYREARQEILHAWHDELGVTG